MAENIVYKHLGKTSAVYNISDDKKTVRVRFPVARMTADDFETARQLANWHVVQTSGVQEDEKILGNFEKTTDRDRIIVTVTVDPAGKYTLGDVKNFIAALEKACVGSNPTPKPDNENTTKSKPSNGKTTKSKPSNGKATESKPGGESTPKDPKEITQDVWGRLFSAMDANKVPGSDKAKQAFWDAYDIAKGNKS